MSILVYLKKKRKRNLELGRLDDTIFVLEKWHTQTVQTQLRLPLRLTDWFEVLWPSQPTRAMSSLSVYLTTPFLGSLSPKWLTVFVQILLPKTDNCPFWISRRKKMIEEKISWSISMKECCRTQDFLITSWMRLRLNHRGQQLPLRMCPLQKGLVMQLSKLEVTEIVSTSRNGGNSTEYIIYQPDLFNHHTALHRKGIFDIDIFPYFTKR